MMSNTDDDKFPSVENEQQNNANAAEETVEQAEGGLENEDKTQYLKKLVKFQRKEMEQQKNPDRQALFTSGKFGRLEIFDDQKGQVIVKGLKPTEEITPPPEPEP